MTVAELLASIIAAYPGATDQAMATFKSVFYARFRDREGDALRDAFEATVADFRATGRQPFPIPADIEANMPSRRLFGGAGGGAIDFKGHAERKRAMLTEWRDVQGARGAGGIAEVWQALVSIAEARSHVAAWNDKAGPLRLSRQDLRLAQHRAISQQRRLEHGRPVGDGAAWWEQVKEIAERWKIPVAYEDWTDRKQTEAT